jgi:hypothetical protein
MPRQSRVPIVEIGGALTRTSNREKGSKGRKRFF